MLPSKQTKSLKLSIVLQLTETTVPGADGRSWEVHDVERNRGFRVRLTGPVLAKAGSRAGKPAVIEGAVGLAIERSLVTPPEKVGGTLDDVDVTAEDLSEAARLGSA
jgi:hypothetical protein